jgi:O-antigen/teichoic acid export membrane protein
MRSSSWLMVAVLFPTVFALALFGLAASLLTCTLGIALVRRALRENRRGATREALGTHPVSEMSRSHMLKESFSFLGLTLGTRAFQTLPLILIGRLLGFEAIGLIGAFMKIVELTALPFTVIGNALMVRAQEIKTRGVEIINRYWDLLFRFGILAMLITGGVFFVVRDIAKVMLPATSGAPRAFAIMTILILFRAVSDLCAPASDYVGGLRKRLTFLLITAATQLPFIWIGVRAMGETGALITMVSSYAFMVIGYIFIAKRVFFGDGVYKPARDIRIAVAIILLSVAIAALVTSSTRIQIATYLFLLGTSFVSIPLLRTQYVSGKFLRFDFLQPSAAAVREPIADPI